jgi:hypothetical protein
MDKLIAASDRLKAAFASFDHNREVEIGMLDAKEKQLLDRFQQLNDMKFKVAEDNGDLDAADEDLVEINAGGKVIAVTRSTLTQFKGTRLEALFSCRWDRKLRRDSAGRIFLDVNPVCFQAIVDYLNDASISTEKNPAAAPSVAFEYQEVLMQQLDFFGISYVVFPSTIFKDQNLVATIHGWLEQDGFDGDLTLLYRSSRDGRNDATFHTKCDNKGPTLTVIETTLGNVIGGFSECRWMSDKTYAMSSKSFLFAISPSGTFLPTKMVLSGSPHHSIYKHPSQGPTFGAKVANCGHDFRVDEEYLHLDIGQTYSGPPSQLVGQHKLTIKEMEVFQVLKKPLGIKAPKADDETRIKQQVQAFTPAINLAIESKWTALLELEIEFDALEASYEDENQFITFVSRQSDKDVLSLNVSGSPMAITYQTLQLCQDSNLASTISAQLEAKSITNQKPVKEWNTEDVVAWLNRMDQVSPSAVKSFGDDGITGCHLLALEREDFVYFGITQRGVIAYILSEIKKLERAQGDTAILIEHAPYCFEKIIDHFRLESMFTKGLIKNKPGLPVVRDSEKIRFEKVVEYYFPGDSSQLLLGN